MYSKSRRGEGTFAHRDIAFEFALWISVELLKQYQNFTYATEADVLNAALFGQTVKQWSEAA